MVAGLSLPTVLPEVANVTVLALMGVGLILVFVQPSGRGVIRQPAVLLPLAAGAILALALVFTATTPNHVLAVLVLAPLFLVGPLASLLQKLGRELTPTLVGIFALVGAAGAFAVAVYDVAVRGLSRGGYSVNNVIHFADLALTIGFVALIGVFGTKGRSRFIFVIGPVLGLIAVVLANSRGPILAAVPVSIAAAAMISGMLLPRRWVLPAAAATLVVLIGGGYLAYVLGFAQRLERLGSVVTLFSSGTTGDSSVGERFHMYISAWNAFQASPIFGHGLIDYTHAAAQYAPPGPVQYKPSQHLHNDIADFAVIGGSLGLLSYVLYLAAPLAGALATRGRWRNAALYLGVVMPVGYFAMGLTNAMIGILTQTVLYAVVLALIAALDVNSSPSSTHES
ncbi:O-antigen ligase family protein [Devosia sp. RR2S18]|uniref:O-antigen ligase family protein n=1 Tax=Devosia rhizosphaerae TaxID=3049774 RepID=UPI0025405CFF|nr:O-antigen ligase family protein [Devosia sp. RR2S18]WIJ24044.1 O-antigen ligase family protein [Devosia sp. RR2S18]